MKGSPPVRVHTYPPRRNITRIICPGGKGGDGGVETGREGGNWLETGHDGGKDFDSFFQGGGGSPYRE